MRLDQALHAVEGGQPKQRQQPDMLLKIAEQPPVASAQHFLVTSQLRQQLSKHVSYRNPAGHREPAAARKTVELMQTSSKHMHGRQNEGCD